MEKQRPETGLDGTSKQSVQTTLITRRKFLGLSGLAGIGWSLKYSSLGPLYSLAESASSEKRILDESFIDLTAETFVSSCSNTAHLTQEQAPWYPSTVYTTKNRVIGVFVGFPDQTGGIADLESGLYHNLFPGRAQLIQDFYNHFMGTNFTIEAKPGYIMADHDWSYYPNGEAVQTEIIARNLLPYYYDGQTYPIICMFDAHNQSTLPKMGGGGNILTGFGITFVQGDMLLNNDYNFKYVLVHEAGHALGLMHNPNLKSVMNPGTYDGLPKLLDASDVQNTCSAVIPPTPTPTPSPTPGSYKLYIPLAEKNALH